MESITSLPYRRVYSVDEAMTLMSSILSAKRGWEHTPEGRYLLNRLQTGLIKIVYLLLNDNLRPSPEKVRALTLGEITAMLAAVIAEEKPKISRDAYNTLTYCVQAIIDKKIVVDEATTRISQILLKEKFVLN